MRLAEHTHFGSRPFKFAGAVRIYPAPEFGGCRLNFCLGGGVLGASLRSFLLTRPNFGKDVFGELSERALQEAQAREL